MELQSELLLYLDNRRILFVMQDHCKQFITSLTAEKVCKFPPFRFFIEIDVMDLLDFSSELGRLLLMEPLKWQLTCDKILYACLKSASLVEDIIITEIIQPSQVAVNLRLKNVSQLSVDLHPHAYKGLAIIKGLLLDISKQTPYVFHTVWSCPEECDGNEVIKRYIPKVPPKCYLCKSNLFENSGLRKCGEMVTATFKVDNNIQTKSFKVVDDLIVQLNIGLRYSVNVVVLKKNFEVWSIEQINILPAPFTSIVPRDIQELYDACGGLSWKFIYCLASTIGVNICPLNCFMHLKINLLLSVTSVKANRITGSNILHVLAAGFDTGTVGAIMMEGAKLSDTSLTLGTSNTLVSTALIGSSGGVCVMPLPLHSYNQKVLSSILSTIESGDIISESGRSKLKSAIWAQGMDFKKIVLHNVANVFGMVCRGDYGEYEDEIAEFLIKRAIDLVSTTKEEVQAMKDVAQYVDVTAGIHVKLNDISEKILRNYFLAARREQTRGVSIGSMESLVTICLTAARLCRRSVANIEDAIFAIWLHVSGSPEPRFAPDEYLQTPADIKQLQKCIYHFKNWLEEFTGCYGI